MARSKVVYQLIINSFSSGIFQLARLSKLPLVGDFLHWFLFRDNHIVYLPADRVIDIGESVSAPENMVLPSTAVNHFIRKAKHRFIMNECLCRAGCNCRDYPSNMGCLFLGEAADQINPKLGRAVDEAEALDHVQKCMDAGLVQMIGRDRLDSVALDIGPDDKLMTICSCCPCCCIWRIIPLASQEISDMIVKMPGVEVTVSESCIGCGICTEGSCFVDAIQLENDRACIGPSCRGCGRCVTVCPNEAIEITISNPDYVAEVIDKLDQLVDLS